MRPKSWSRFSYGVARIVYMTLVAQSMITFVTMLFTWSVFRFAIILARVILRDLWDLLNEGLES